MPWIKIIRPEEAEGELKEVYRKLAAQRAGEAINQAREATTSPARHAAMLHSPEPPRPCGTLLRLMWEVMRGESRLSTAQREMIATVTSATLNCRF